MRPHKLTMTAFGPFAKETVVDFDTMGNNIYLISGDTGAGKTTIFDGIIYALYGTASGGARSNLGTEAFHSDYAKDGVHREEMRVQLEFSNAGHTYTVERKMFWGKKGDSAKATKQSMLSENGNTIVHSKGKEDKDEVTAKVTEILGLDADQFRRIIMLAQGEFQKFLTAKSDERGAILGKLYDNRKHQDFQMRLKAARELLRNQDKQLIEKGNAQTKLFVFPDDVDEELREMVSIDHPKLLFAVKQIVTQMREKQESLKTIVNEKEAKKDQLKQQKTKGQHQNTLLDDLDSKKKALVELETQSEQIADLKATVERVAIAEKVIPTENAMRQAITEWKDSLRKIVDLEAERDRLAEEISKLEKCKDNVARINTPKIKELEGKQASIQNVLSVYDKLASSIEKYNQITKEHEKAISKVKDTLTLLTEKQTRKKELEDVLKKLASAGDSKVLVAKHKVEDLVKTKNGLVEIRKEIQKVYEQEEQAIKLKEIWANTVSVETQAERVHHQLYTAFIQGQASIIADELRNQLKEQPEVTCPVCGSVHTKADEPAFAVCNDEIPTRADVDIAFDKFTKAQKNRKEAEDHCSVKNNEITSKKTVILGKSLELLEISDWEVLVSGNHLANAISECEQLLIEANSQYVKAETDKKQKEAAMNEKISIDTAVENATDDYERFMQREHQIKTEKASVETRIDLWKKQLEDYPESKQEAEELIHSFEEKINVLRKAVDDAKEEYDQCKTAKATNQGNLDSTLLEKETRRQKKEDLEEAFEEQLKEKSFADIHEYHNVLSPEGVLLTLEEVDDWISKQNKTIGNYETKYRDLKSAIKQLSESTKDMDYTDLQEINVQIEAISKELENLNKLKEAVVEHVGRNQDIYKNLCKIQKQRAKFGKVFAKLSPLVDTADGKFAFSRYVLVGFFHRIVEQANIHLETLTDGEYCLVPKETGDGRTNIGLELKVLNTITNLERNTASLSGGQLFEASLSLALGLSDVVQMESTSNIQIDSMFIDEGFGSLDGGRLDKSIEVLQHLSGGKRQIGIISHVSRLDECIPKKIHVIAGTKGSKINIETDA